MTSKKNGNKSRDSWKTLSQRTLVKREPYVTLIEEKVRTSKGKIVDDYYRVKLPKFAACVALTEEQKVITLWQYKHGPKCYSLTSPAGFIEPGEAPDIACKRELLEETGYTVGSLISLGSFVDGGNQEGSTGHYFLAVGCKKTAEPDDGDLEIAKIRLMSVAEVVASLANNDFAIAHHVIAWFLAKERLGQIAD